MRINDMARSVHFHSHTGYRVKKKKEQFFRGETRRRVQENLCKREDHIKRSSRRFYFY